MKLFDWFTVFAQIVNFLILVALLKHFLYGRILRAIDSRESAIKSRLAEAEENLHQAELEKQDFQKRLHELEDARDAMLSQSQQDADRKRLDLMKKAREEIAALEERWRADLERERTALFQDIRGRAAGGDIFRATGADRQMQERGRPGMHAERGEGPVRRRIRRQEQTRGSGAGEGRRVGGV